MEGGEEGIGERKRMEGADAERYRAAIIFLAPSSQDTRPEQQAWHSRCDSMHES